jgi:tetratricopeptide (TPR) repeat protein
MVVNYPSMSSVDFGPDTAVRRRCSSFPHRIAIPSRSLTPVNRSRKLTFPRKNTAQEATLGSRTFSALARTLIIAFPILGTVALSQAHATQNSPAAPSSAESQKTVSRPMDAAQSNARLQIQLETSESLFATLAAINVCGYDQDLANSDPVRAQIRAEFANAWGASAEAGAEREQICRFISDKQQADASQDLAQYVTLAIFLGDPPEFTLTAKEADLPPDASNVLGFVPLLKKFYEAVGGHQIWLKHQGDYERMIARLQDPVSQLILKTDFYLKLPLSSYMGRKFVIYVDPLGAPSQVNARNYRTDYFLVLSPANNGSFHPEQVRHTYLHYVIDAFTAKRANAVKRLNPLLQLVKTAPLEESYKNDTTLMVVESLIRAIEARTLTTPGPAGDAKKLEAFRSSAADLAMQQGFILTRYFYDALINFEQSPTGFNDSFSDMLYAIDVDKEKKRISNINFTSKAAPELLTASNVNRPQMLDLAEAKLSSGDVQGAHRIAQEVLDRRTEDPARAMFILARAATLNKEIDNAQSLFERTLEIAHEPRTIAWSHIYIGRILDLKCNRDSALSHYRAALNAGDPTPDIKSAADKGITELPPGCEKDQ